MAVPMSEAAPVSDPGFDSARAQLLQRSETLDLGAGADPAETAALREELKGMVDRYQPGAGQTTDDALAGLRDEYDQRIQDFTQDQKIQALIEEQLRDNQADPASPAGAAAPTDPTTIDPTTIDPATIDPATIDPTTIDPATTTDPAAPEPGPILGGMPIDPSDFDLALPEGYTIQPGDNGSYVVLDQAGNPAGTVDDYPTMSTEADPLVEVAEPPFVPANGNTGVVGPAIVPEAEIAADPDDGGEVGGTLASDLIETVATRPGMIVDEFDSMSEQYQETFTDAVAVATEQFDPRVSMPAAALDDVVGDVIDRENYDANFDNGYLPGIDVAVPDVVADQLGSFLPEDLSGTDGGTLAYAEAALDDLGIPVPDLDDLQDRADDFVQDQMDDVQDQMDDVQDQVEDTLGGIADDLGL